MPPLDAGMVALLMALLGGAGACGKALVDAVRGRKKAEADEREAISAEGRRLRQELRDELVRIARRVSEQEAVIARQSEEIAQLHGQVEALQRENSRLKYFMGVLDLHIDPSYRRPAGTPGALAGQP